MKRICNPRSFWFALIVALLTAAGASAAPADAPTSFRVDVTGNGPALVLLPGLASSGAVWDETVAQYKDRYTCHVITLAGFGGLPAVDADPMLATVRDELAAYLRSQAPSGAVVVGHSLGGVLALWLAAEAPDVVAAAVVVDALPYLAAAQMPTATPEGMAPQAEAMRAMMAGQSQAQFRQSQAAILRTMITDSADVAKALATGGESQPAAVGQAFYELMTTDLRPLLPRIEAPVLVIGTWAGSQPYLTRAQVQQTFDTQYAGLPGVRLMLHDTARHFVMYDDPEGLFREIDGFLQAP